MRLCMTRRAGHGKGKRARRTRLRMLPTSARMQVECHCHNTADLLQQRAIRGRCPRLAGCQAYAVPPRSGLHCLVPTDH